MQNEDLIREIATVAFCEALQERSQEFAENIAHRMGVALGMQPPPQREHTKELRDGAMLIVGARTQTETLEALLAASSAITNGCGLLIVRGGQATGWNCNGITTLEDFKRAGLDCTRGVAATVINSCTAMTTQVSELDPVFASKLGLQSSAQVLLVPVLLKERVAALLIALPKQSDDLPGLELLVQVAQLALDLQAYRKAALQPSVAPSRQTTAHQLVAEPPKPVAPIPPRPEPVYAAAPARTPVPPSPVIHDAVSAYSESATQAAQPALDEAHEKARRFAKLLVEEIKLYNQTKVAEGRARGDLYSRLREEIEKSRAAYQKRYGESVRDVDYFTQELMRILADNSPALMGTGFPG